MRRRVTVLSLLGAAALLALCVRLCLIQAVYQPDLAAGALAQQEIEIRRQNRRGVIYDRNGLPLTDQQQSYNYLLENSRWDRTLFRLLRDAGAVRVGTMGSRYAVYRTDTFDAALHQTLADRYGAYTFCTGQRYAEQQTAVHLIGYLNRVDGEGQTGLEKRYQFHLTGAASSYALLGDGAGVPLRGTGLRQTAGAPGALHPAALVTTLDARLQRQVENILADRAERAAVVVLDTETGGVLAMASTPGFDPNRVEQYLGSDRGELINKAIQGQYPPGSVFKLVVAAAALEADRDHASFQYTCTGQTRIGGASMTCESRPEGHGTLDLQEALAQSCNCYFAQLGQEIGAEAILDMAERMGLGRCVLDGFSEEAAGLLPGPEEYGVGGLANLSVGQGSLLVTPLQIACMTNVIASGGLRRDVTVVRESSLSISAAPESGTPQGTPERVLRAETAAALQRMMEQVCRTGTAADAADCAVPVGGKTGSAEAGQGDAYRVHGWFTGFFPVYAPRYTVTVFVENGETGSGSALPVFTELVNWLYG